MPNWEKAPFKYLRQFSHWLDDARNTPFRRYRRRNQEIEILIYDGYGNNQQARTSGRVLIKKKRYQKETLSYWRQFKNTYRLFRSREIAGAKLLLKWQEQERELTSDREGYFDLLIEPLHVSLKKEDKLLLQAELKSTPYGRNIEEQFEGKCHLHDSSKGWGLITDIDDTILKSDVSSWFKWKAVYNTFFEDLNEREPIQDAAAFIQKISKQAAVFYVSNSPWNLYPFLKDFLNKHTFPDAPVLLRDLGIPVSISDTRPHKIKTISQVLEMYPGKRFLLLGDSGEKDAAYYKTIDQLYPGRIHRKFIRQVPGTLRRESTDRMIYFETYSELLDWLEIKGIR